MLVLVRCTYGLQSTIDESTMDETLSIRQKSKPRQKWTALYTLYKSIDRKTIPAESEKFKDKSESESTFRARLWPDLPRPTRLPV